MTALKPFIMAELNMDFNAEKQKFYTQMEDM